MKTASLCTLLVISLLASGCVTGRRTISPKVPSAQASTTKGSIALRNVTDDRHFEDKSAGPSTPSVHGKLAQMTPDQLAMMVGRQGNTGGRAMGDLALADGQTVMSKVRELVSAGFAHRGYATSSSPSKGNDVDVHINEFWAWFTPGFWSVDFEARIQCGISVKGRNMVVTGYGKNSGQMANDTNWEQAYEYAFADFLKNLESQLAQNGF
jgi:hypothetical protein